MTETEIPKGSYAAGHRVKLPAGAEAPYAVFINGIDQREGADYEVSGGEVVFTRQIVKEKVGTGRWLAMYLGSSAPTARTRRSTSSSSGAARSN